MRIAYFDCYVGASGDMILGALVDAGLDPDDLRRELTKLPLGGFEVRTRQVMKQHLQATEVEVVVHDPAHERRGSEIEAIIASSPLNPQVREKAVRIVRRLAEAEARVHGTTADQIHLHEAGGLDCIVDICGAVVGLHLFGVEKVFCSPLPISRGFVTFSHGTWPVPGPAVLELARGVPLVPLEVEEETLTPTGAAILTTLADGYGPLPPMRLERVAYGAGKKTLQKPIPNALRLLLGQASSMGGADVQTLTLLETNIDDMPAEWFDHAMGCLFQAGALDVYLVPIHMKKNRPAALLGVLCPPDRTEALLEVIYRETTTFGVRISRVERHALEREEVVVQTPWGAVPVKRGRWKGKWITCSPEYEVCRQIAQQKEIPLKTVYSRVQAACCEEPLSQE